MQGCEFSIEALTATYAKINVEYQTDSQLLEFIKTRLKLKGADFTP